MGERDVKSFDVPDANIMDQSWTAHGLQCRTVRHPSLGHWCGYVGLPVDHPDHSKDYYSVDVDVHGGLTFARENAPNEKPDGNWWFGFDTAHVGDLVPGMRSHFKDETYKDAAFVVAETNSLAAQLAARTQGSE